MIQRKQTVFLLLAFIFGLICLSSQIGTYEDDGFVSGRIYNLWVTDSTGNHSFTTWPLMTIMLPACLLSLCTVFLYKNRILQARLCVVNIFLMVAWYICFVLLCPVESVNLQWTAALPAVNALLIFLARKYILADERLVRSMDRIR